MHVTQDRFLREWIEFHLCAGVQHFFMYVDRPSNSCYQAILEP
jgi:hypothetical protein